MYKLKTAKGSYLCTIELSMPNGKETKLQYIEHISIRTCPIGNYSITLLGTTDETLDGLPMQDFDAVMLLIGKALYPVELNLREDNSIESVSNFDMMKQTWQKRCSNILAIYENADLVKHYIDITAKNIANEATFLSAFMRGGFMPLFLAGEPKATHVFFMYDFPHVGDVTETHFSMPMFNGAEFIYHMPKKESKSFFKEYGLMHCQYPGSGLPEYIEMERCVEADGEGYYRKKMMIKLIK